ncbi:PAS domain S-box protein [Halobellus sp. GM3]|uniref:PAS domain S-box protein n=1 Tax=Halobellus sp. GM3 TaxID=3458410 RepID=UPI00403DCBC2
MTGGTRLLHVDDDAPNSLSEFLAATVEDVEVVPETHPDDGLDQLADGADRFDCVVSGYRLPGMDGVELLERVRESRPELPFVLVADDGGEAVASRAVDAGVTAYLSSGADSERYERLADSVRDAVETYRTARRDAAHERLRRTCETAEEAAVRAESRAAIERRVCEVLGESDHYRTARIDDTARIHGSGPEPAASDGGVGPPVQIERAPADGVSSAAVQIDYDGDEYGILTVETDRTEPFDERERARLAELATRVGHALSRAEATTHRERYERLLTALDVGSFRTTIGRESRIVEADAALADFLSADGPDALRGRPVSEFYRGATSDADCDRRLERDGVVRNRDVRVETLAGEERWGSMTAVLTDADGETYVDGILRDVTDRRRQTRQLRRSRKAIEASGHSVYFTDRNGKIRYVNPAFEEATGYAAEEAIGQTPAILKSGEHDREFYERLWDTILSGDVWRSEIVNKRKSGERYVVDQTIAPVDGDDGTIEGFVAVNADISELKRREAELERSRERLRALFEHSPDAIIVHDAEGDVSQVNRQSIENLGYSREELLSMNVSQFEVEHTREELQLMWTTASVGERIQLEGSHRRSDGTTFPVEVWVTKMELDSEQRFIAFSRDITERKADERELERQIDRLEQFATVVSHDLRNPLNVAEGRIDLVQAEYESDHLDAARDALDRMEELIEDLLILAREGGRTSGTEPIALDSIAQSCWQTVSTADATLIVDTERTIRADRSRLQQLLENLLRNAVEHAGNAVTMTIGDTDGGFYVSDDGPGIPEDERDRVFETGFTTADDGTGLGLNIVKQIADAHEWDVAVIESETGGARFEFTSVDVVE